ncbi:transposase [Hyphomonas sp. CACIAM 19H1]|uniref:IS1595 family transposase n=1 Tax=Hyphomonas sp. CACIAM 19H1 TaxID=1873716 RepID=UPI000DED647F|nr:IS1595 family transposase [Hyphomonas sp. CACIAM 19H1]AXE65989.1 transposase [Hyphomonas sp. CACIAM 19H1]
MSILSKPYFHDEAAAFEHVESVLWPEGPVCPFCGGVNSASKLVGVRSKPSKANPEGVERFGLYKCKHKECRKQFTVRKGTIFEESHLPLHKWLQAIYLMCASKKGFSAHQMHRVLEVQYKTAWFLCHRIRLAMADGSLNPFGGNGGDVEVDETFIGKDPDAPKGKRMAPWQERNKVLTLIDRQTRQARSVVIDDLKSSTIGPIVQANVAYETRILTDEAPRLRPVGSKFAVHKRVNHAAEEWVSKEDRTIHTNTVEGYFSVFKRGMKGTYQHCSKKHLHRYLAEFDFRYNNRSANGIEDSQRLEIALHNVTGKRLTYRDSSWARS